MAENKETKQEVTNEMLLEHLNEIENSIGVSQTWLMTINKMMMLRKDKLNLDSEELLTLKTAEIALRFSVDNMQSMSGLKERMEEIKAEYGEKMDKFLDELFETLF